MALYAHEARANRADANRELILLAAERLFAEHGITAVSNRQISEAAGQGNNSAVGYHFGTKTDLVLAVTRRHQVPIEALRSEMLAETLGSGDVRDWVACLVHPLTEHLESLGTPTWFARFSAQMLTDPQFLPAVTQEALEDRTLRKVLEGLETSRPDLPPEVLAEREAMVRQLLMHTCAERERALAEGRPTPRASWSEAATGLVDAITGLWLAPFIRDRPNQ
ncbi:TetR/AcrR family transcriptional regulator [Paenarthrobacter sp. NPDC091669]|uniref:TetR/AcrR family transcriptional regulator n=1 Tax=Paenarthrobacter sp. NPDC091669 TaxID=3364384 RepID=UPI0037F76B79